MGRKSGRICYDVHFLTVGRHLQLRVAIRVLHQTMHQVFVTPLFLPLANIHVAELERAVRLTHVAGVSAFHLLGRKVSLVSEERLLGGIGPGRGEGLQKVGGV
jgi:hypothetical protein